MYNKYCISFLKYGDYDYPVWADFAGICLTLIIILQVPGWAIYALWKQKKGQTLKEVKLSEKYFLLRDIRNYLLFFKNLFIVKINPLLCYKTSVLIFFCIWKYRK